MTTRNSIREYVADDAVRGRIETIALSVSMLGLGGGLATMWSYVFLIQAGPDVPPAWMFDAIADIRLLLWVCGGLLAAGTAVMAAIIFTDDDFATGTEEPAD